MDARSKTVRTVVIPQDGDTPLPTPAMVAHSHPSSPAITPLADRRGSRIAQGWTKRRIQTWRSPLVMVLFYILGLSVSVAHCIFYPKLKGNVVGNSNQQEEKIRFGTAFAFLAQICLGASVWTVYTQWLWRTVKRKEMTVGAWNSAFGADTSVLSLLNLEMVRKLRVGSAMAFFAWSLLLPPFFTPATLFIYESVDSVEIIAAMPYPAIANASEAHRFSYSPPTQRGTTEYLNDTSRTFTGPRTVLSLIASATSSLGEILTVDLPSNNSAYSVQFFAPIIKCEDADTDEVEQIDKFLKEDMASISNGQIETDSAYYGFVPTYNSTGHLTAVWRPRQQTPSKPINQLWMTFLRPTFDQEGNRVKRRHYQVCQPHNATYNVTISQYHGFQDVSGTYSVGETIPFPYDGPENVSNMSQHAYTAFMWVLCDQLVGKFAWYTETNLSSTANSQSAAQFGVIDSPIQRNSLLGSLDLDAFFEMDEEKGLFKNQNTSQIYDLSDQRLQDKAMAKNRTLDVLIEELSFNLTISLMHNRLLTQPNDSLVTLTVDVNRYSYKPHGLFIPYVLANLFAFVCVVIGISSYINDGVLPGKKVQDIIYAARNPAIHSRPSLSRRMSMGAGLDEKGEIEIRVVQVHDRTECSDQQTGSMFKKLLWKEEKHHANHNAHERGEGK